MGRLGIPARGGQLLVPTGDGGENGPGAAWAVCRLTCSYGLSCMPSIDVGGREIPVGTVASVLAGSVDLAVPSDVGVASWGGGSLLYPPGTLGVSCSALLFLLQTGRLEQLWSCQEGV